MAFGNAYGIDLAGIYQARSANRLRDLAMKQQEQQIAQGQRQQSALAALVGGYDPQSGITWNTGRQGMDDDQKRGLFAQAFPEVAAQAEAKQLYPQALAPNERYRVTEGGGIIDLAADGGPSVLREGRAKAPAGMRFKADGSGLEPIPGYVETQSRIASAGRASREPRLAAVPDPNSPTGFSYQPVDTGVPAVGPSTTRVVSDGKGGFTLEQGPQGGRAGDGLARPTVNKVEEGMLMNSGRLERLNTIAQQFRPEFLTIPNQIATGGLAMWERMGGNLSPESRQQVAEYSKFASDTYNELNTTLKEMSGAAVTPQEAERLLKVIPNPGSDSPTQFKAKLDATLKAVKLANARLAYIRQNGLSPENFGGVSIAQMPTIIDQRGAELEAQFRSQGVPAEQIREQVKAQLAQEFGL